VMQTSSQERSKVVADETAKSGALGDEYQVTEDGVLVDSGVASVGYAPGGADEQPVSVHK
jgi:hypothetical protein